MKAFEWTNATSVAEAVNALKSAATPADLDDVALCEPCQLVHGQRRPLVRRRNTGCVEELAQRVATVLVRQAL